MDKRDLQLDAYRSIIMIYIVCVIHVLYWLNIGNEIIKSILLIEMPIVFFISGASIKVSNGIHRSFFNIVVNRFKRIIVPYYEYIIYSFLFILIISISGLSSDKDITKIDIHNLIGIISLKGFPMIPMQFHLWFLTPYFIISLSLPLQLKILNYISNNIYLLINIVIFAIIDYITSDLTANSYIYYLKTCIGYNIFYLVGLFYYKELKLKSLLLIIVGSFFVFMFYSKGETFVMQLHKFPPDMFFISYNMIALSFLCLIMSYIKIPYNKVIKFWNRNGYELYLYQNYAFYIFRIICVKVLSIKIESGMLWFLISSVSIFFISIGINLIKQKIDVSFHFIKNYFNQHK